MMMDGGRKGDTYREKTPAKHNRTGWQSPNGNLIIKPPFPQL
jgi:hypothetical protein